jgi:hypothetical protein
VRSWGLSIACVVICVVIRAAAVRADPRDAGPAPVVTVTFRIGHVDEGRYTNDVDVIVGTTPPRRVHLAHISCGCQLEGHEWADPTPGAIILGCYFAGGGQYVVVHPDGGGRWTIRTFHREEDLGHGEPPRDDERVLLRFRAPPGTSVRGVVDYGP